MNNFQMGHCEDCLMYKCEVASLKGRLVMSAPRIALVGNKHKLTQVAAALAVAGPVTVMEPQEFILRYEPDTLPLTKRRRNPNKIRSDELKGIGIRREYGLIKQKASKPSTRH